MLGSCYGTCLRLAEERGLDSLSFPSISTGAYGYPVEEAAAVAMERAVRYLESADARIREIIFVLFDRVTYDVYTKALRAVAR